jgi:hypothetical protein
MKVMMIIMVTVRNDLLRLLTMEPSTLVNGKEIKDMVTENNNGKIKQLTKVFGRTIRLMEKVHLIMSVEISMKVIGKKTKLMGKVSSHI